MCYRVSKERLTWSEAREKCQGTFGVKLGDLASISDNETMAFIEKNLQLVGSTWFGGEKIDGTWKWADGTTWDYTNWATYQLGSDDGVYLGIDYLWYNYDKTDRKFYLCQNTF